MAEKRCRRDFTRAEVLDLLDYDPETGIFRWKIEKNSHGGKIYPGSLAGTSKDGYCQIKLFGIVYRAHHLAWLIMTGEWPDRSRDVDHRNRDRSDNRWDNLRYATRAQNNINGAPHRNNKSGTKGVSFVTRTGLWDARIKVNGKVLTLGQHQRLDDAVAARREAENRIYGEFSYHSET